MVKVCCVALLAMAYTWVDGKLRLLAETFRSAVLWPVRSTVEGELAAELATARLAARYPGAVGLNTTEIAHVAEAAMVVGQFVLLPRWKSPALVPVKVMLDTVTGLPVALVTCTDCCALVSPSAAEKTLSPVGDSVRLVPAG